LECQLLSYQLIAVGSNKEDNTMEKHKIFISFYHKDDDRYKRYLVDRFSYLFINKSVENGEYDPDDSDEYVKRLIREDKITDSSIIVVLIGPNTYKRKHVDWEIYAGLRESINGRSALLGIVLPEYRLDAGNKFRYEDIPARLADNVKSGYSKIYSWSYAIQNFSQIINDAFNEKNSIKNKADNSRQQMKYNRS
jgi:hypothetical protein